MRIAILITTLLSISCNKFIDIPPPEDQIINSTAFSDSTTAVAAVTGIYSTMMESMVSLTSNAVTLYAGMSADELYCYNAIAEDEFTTNAITVANHALLDQTFWNPAYKYIYSANACLEGLNRSKTLAATIKNRLIGEAKFIRAFCYFHLVNLFGDVPIVTVTDYTVNAVLPRAPVTQVYQQMINDLKDAQARLGENYPTGERVRPNKWAATALLASVYLYTADWENAGMNASAVINAGAYTLEADMNAVFLAESREAIWQLQPVVPGFNTWEAYRIVPASDDALPTFLLTGSLFNAFEANDQRKINWIASRTYAGQKLYYPYKYKANITGAPLTEYYTVLRLAEQLLIRAEARAQQNNIAGAREDIDMIRKRAGLPATAANTKAALLAAIEQERRVELFAEWGHRWYDLKRTGRANTVLSAYKPATWQATDVLWPVPIDEIDKNPALKQNEGY